jgi:pilus assembly protein CpaE
MPTSEISIVVLSDNLDNFNEIRNALAVDSRLMLLSGGNDVEQVHDEVLRLKPSAAIISLGANAEPAVKLIQRLTEECPGTAVISVARETSADLILQSLRAGAREFLRIPISADEMKTVFDRVQEFCEGQATAQKKIGQMTAVFSSKGGCGTSFIATNLAACASTKTVLVDLNLEAGDLPLFLGVDPRRSISDLIAHRGVFDKELLAAYVTPYSANLHLLAAPKEVDPIDKVKPEHIFEVLRQLRECYDHVVLDPQHTFDAVTLAALDQSDKIVLVLTLDIPAIRSAKRALQVFDRVGYPRTKTMVVVNRWSKQVDLDLRQVEEFLGEPVIGSLPSDYQTVVNSVNLGTPLVESNSSSKIAVEVKRVARMLAAGPASARASKPKRPWNFFLKR